MFLKLGIVDLVGLISLAGVFFLLILVILKNEKIKSLKDSLEKLKKSFEALDEQAKLIFRTDLELNKAQEALDRKVSCLYTLQKLSRLISTTLDKEEIFQRIKEPLIRELGFEKAVIFIFEETPKLKLKIGYPQAKDKDFEDIFREKKPLSFLIKERKPLSSLKYGLSKEKDIQYLKEFFGVEDFIAAPVFGKEKILGVILLGTTQKDTLTEGDEELVEILSTHIAQALENAQLFEATWRSHQQLEVRVKQRTKELSEALEKIKAISRRKSEFVSAVAHELRTPLTSIKGYASILLTEKLGKVPQEVKLRLEKIDHHSDELNHLIGELLDISRIESGKIEMKIAPQDIKVIVEEVVDLLNPQLKEKHLTLAVKLSESLAKALVDYQQIKRVFINLLGNAIKFTPEEGEISISAEEQKNFLQICIQDTGIGIPQEAQARIFDEFYRVDNPINQKIKGAGLGLSLVKYIIEAHKGKIWVKSKPGKGTAFFFTVPKEEC